MLYLACIETRKAAMIFSILVFDDKIVTQKLWSNRENNNYLEFGVTHVLIHRLILTFEALRRAFFKDNFYVFGEDKSGSKYVGIYLFILSPQKIVVGICWHEDDNLTMRWVQNTTYISQAQK